MTVRGTMVRCEVCDSWGFIFLRYLAHKRVITQRSAGGKTTRILVPLHILKQFGIWYGRLLVLMAPNMLCKPACRLFSPYPIPHTGEPQSFWHFASMQVRLFSPYLQVCFSRRISLRFSPTIKPDLLTLIVQMRAPKTMSGGEALLSNVDF